MSGPAAMPPPLSLRAAALPALRRLWRPLLASDINYYLAARPPAFLVAAGIGAVLVLTAAAWLACLLVRWLLTVPVCLFEGLGGQAALRRSAALVRGRGWLVLGVLVAWQAGKA